jgi:hypothetical protein
LDVVEALRKDWSFDPFKFIESDGYFYGRGTTDENVKMRRSSQILFDSDRKGIFQAAILLRSPMARRATTMAFNGLANRRDLVMRNTP